MRTITVEPYNPAWPDGFLRIRDYLRKYDKTRDEYAVLKQSLAEKHRRDIDSYVEGKHDFIMNIVEKARNEKTLEDIRRSGKEIILSYTY